MIVVLLTLIPFTVVPGGGREAIPNAIVTLDARGRVEDITPDAAAGDDLYLVPGAVDRASALAPTAGPVCAAELTYNSSGQADRTTVQASTVTRFAPGGKVTGPTPVTSKRSS